MLILLYSSFSTPAIACTSASGETDVNFRSSENLQEGNSQRIIFFQEFSTELSLEITRYSPLNLGFLSKSREFRFMSDRNSEEYKSWIYLQDIKSLIKNQIFPFHVFW
ncbi:hypothetical protein RM549_07745 [Salegentibacter sp. F188]|uniref:Lipoprotein n=1 Tax=Autumnicola patrickiae TaxID=3075591 RepID=A0ABU3E0Z5_9FLAO|nr:hypothetical protein [Salegentibacter sp. F188]MDT0689674.1 hypothetical protein [Salegentibacter sp. F188]